MVTTTLLLLLALSPIQDRRAVAPPSAEETRTAFRAAAQALESIDYSATLHGQTALGRDPSESRPLAELLARRDPLALLTPLLSDPDARVRTLALLALYDREDPKLLPQIAALATDGAASIPETGRMAVRLPAGEKPPTLPHTVGWCAHLMVSHYMEQAGFPPANLDPGAVAGFEAYWNARKERSFCAGWLLVRQERAFGASSPVHEDSTRELRALRDEVDRLPPTDRAMTLLWLPDVENHFSTEAERLQAARSLGREKLLALLQRQVPSDDPDLLVNPNVERPRFPCAGIVRFVLAHANELLKAEDGGQLLELGAAERTLDDERSFPAMNTAWWEIAAANLEPAKAKEILELAHARIATVHLPRAAEERAELWKAYWSLCGNGTDDWLAERFHAETLESDSMPPARRNFLVALGQDGSLRARGTLARLVRDPGFAALDAGTLRELAQVVDGWMKPPIFGERELWDLSHPLGESFLRTQKQIEDAARQHPEATRAFLAKLDDWRARIVKSLPQWAPTAAK